MYTQEAQGWVTLSKTHGLQIGRYGSKKYYEIVTMR